MVSLSWVITCELAQALAEPHLLGAGNVLIPTDTAGRTLELVLLLERHWQQHRLSYPLALLTPVAYSTLEFAKSQLEWMNNEIGAAFERSRANPFECRRAPHNLNDRVM